MTDEQKIKILTNAVLVSIIRLEEIRYQIASDKVIEFLKESLQSIKKQ